ncbi:hypothetical protein BBK82_40840 [Lentzea guizhouensis]|uniref:Uncharacterized protein n=1 Tax=Lentzea guizhouensis TaxID=1586287 RepID=A0A1B2HUG5_9PSEU|nr:hypothetical protein [Lentzea guizhouensis]ANZ41371.1 hypothetical protein BBK82_40840 [Lentzea guizhouensis]
MIGSWSRLRTYAAQTLGGTFANAIAPWDDLLGAPVEAKLVEGHGVPLFTSHPLLDRDLVLREMHDPLPVAVRATLGDVWTVERGPSTC